MRCGRRFHCAVCPVVVATWASQFYDEQKSAVNDDTRQKNGAVGTTSAQRPAGRAQHAHTLATRHDLYGLLDEPRAEGVVGGRYPGSKSATVACDPKTHGSTAVSGERDSVYYRLAT